MGRDREKVDVLKRTERSLHHRPQSDYPHQGVDSIPAVAFENQNDKRPPDRSSTMRDVWLIFVSIFAAGIVSLLLELSLLREFIYIFGSTAASNALIISVFLVGLAVGAYLGTGKRLRVVDETDARRKYAFVQLLNILFVVAFCMTKKYFIYDCPYPNAVRLYFIGSVFGPSLLSGLAYAISVKIMHWRGEKFVTYIYAFSTFGSVVGGLAHGILLVPLWGMRSTYLLAVIFAAIALYLMHSAMTLVRKVQVVILVLVACAVIQFNLCERLFPSKDILYSKDSDFGIVEVWHLGKGDALYKHLALGGKESDFKMDGEAIDLKVNSRHQKRSKHSPPFLFPIATFRPVPE